MINKKVAFLIVILFNVLHCYAQQYTVEGRVIDQSTGVALPFVNMIVTAHPQTGTTADIDGNFKISAPFRIASLTFSYVGYKDTVISLNNYPDNIKGLIIKLQEVSFKLREVRILPGINPALRIIQAAIDNKDKNNPEKVHSFTYDSYNKLYCTSDLKGSADTANSLDSAKTHHDSAHHAHHSVRNLLKKQYLFMMESVSQRKYLYPAHNYEKVIASRTSGLTNSPFALLAQQLQSFSFYTTEINIFGIDYLNPVSDEGIKRYYFVIEDTLYSGKDSVFIISFKPKRGKNFNAMKGVIYINTNGYAFQNVLATPIAEDKSATIHIQQKYELISPTPTSGAKGMQWFPVQLNTDWYYNNSHIGDSTIAIGSQIDTSTKDDYNKLKIVSRSYIKNIVLDTALRKSEFGKVEVEVADDASDKSDDFWNKYRVDTLSKKEKRTYRVVDSIGKAGHFDRILKWFEVLGTGEFKIHWVNIDLDKILNYNGYEKFRLGLGAHTNDAFSKFLSVGGYGAYGTGDGAFKYGGDIGFIFDRDNNVKLDFAYQQDVIGAGMVSFYNDRNFLSTENYYNYFINNMDKMQKEAVYFSFDALRYFQFNIFGDEQLRTTTNSYEYGIGNDNVTFLTNQYWFTEAGIQFRFAYKENFMKSPLGMISLGTKYPIIWGNITQGFNSLLNGGYQYTKYDLKISKDFKIPLAGYSSVLATAGYVQGNVPYTLLYDGKGTYQEFTFGNLPLAVDNSFETMRLNEFLSNRYVNFFYSHNFQSFLFHTEKFRPELKLVFHAGWGKLSNPQNQFDISYKTMDKGYYESGIELNNLIKSSFLHIGIGGYYRMGPYSLATPSDNLAIKLTITTSLQ